MLTPQTAPSWSAFIRANLPLLILFNEARGLLTVWQAWVIMLTNQ